MQTLKERISGFGNHGRRRTILSCITTLGLLILLTGGLTWIPSSAASGSQYHNVQIFLQTQTQSGNLYTLVAYQSNGTLVSNIQSNYPAFSLELPSGTFLFAASVVNKSSSMWWYYSTVEYGYAVEQISGDQVINLQTQTLSSIPTSKITITAQFVNGTAMSGASLYASVIGMNYWAPMYNSAGLVLWNQTAANGEATLTVPKLPLEVTAWNWIFVKLPQNDTTLQENIGGQKVNVTVYWQPMYLGLSGSALIIPPVTSAQITMYANQQPNYWFYPAGTGYATSPVTSNGYPGMGVVSNSGSAMPAQVASSRQEFTTNPGGPAQNGGTPPQYLPPNEIPNIIPVSSQDPLSFELMAVAVIAAVGVAFASLLVVVLGRRHSKLGLN